jgi:hypothetical protein
MGGLANPFRAVPKQELGATWYVQELQCVQELSGQRDAQLARRLQRGVKLPLQKGGQQSVITQALMHSGNQAIKQSSIQAFNLTPCAGTHHSSIQVIIR